MMLSLYPKENICYRHHNRAEWQAGKRVNLVSRTKGELSNSLDDLRSRGPIKLVGTVHAKTWGYEISVSDRILLGHCQYSLADNRLVSEGDQEIFLRPQSALVLQILASNLGQLVDRDDLITKVWGDISVTDDSLTQCIADIRRVIGDDDHTLLKTIRKRGYVLLGQRLDTSPSDADISSSNAQVSTVAPIQAQLDPRDVMPTIAIMPLRGLGDEKEEPLGLFLADDITSALTRSNEVNIISRLSTMGVQKQVSSLTELGQMLNADFILNGLFIRESDALILSFEFADVENNFVLWTDRIKLPMATLMTDAGWVDQLVIQIRNVIMLNEIRRVQSRSIGDLRLFSVLQGAVGLMHKFSVADFKVAHGYLEYVIQQAPSPTPLAWMARWHVLKAVQGWSEDQEKDAKIALDFTSRALDLDPYHSMALVCEGQVLANLSHRLDDAKERYDLALQSNPNDAQGLGLRGMLSTFRDQADQGLRDSERALHLTPLDPHRFYYLLFAAAANLSKGDPKRAVILAKESLRLNRTHVSTLRTLAAAQVEAGDIEDARKTAKTLMELQPNLRLSEWRRNSPSAQFAIGQHVARLLNAAGIPE